MSKLANTTKYLKAYKPPEFSVDSLYLEFELNERQTMVTAKMQLRQLHEDAPLILNGENLNLQWVKLNDRILTSSEYILDDEQLVINEIPAQFTLETQVEIDPAANTALSGLYLSNENFCTQCEAQGFRRITYYFDRPDYLTTFTTKIIASLSKFPVLLSNGNLIEEGKLDEDKHFATWHDPFKKPCYLFALVAGNLAFIQDSFITKSSKEVTLKIFVEPGNQAKATYAMTAVKQAMKWDEEHYNREYDLDIFMIVAVSDFNMGAMENKGLNLFNSKYILASEDTATDEDYEQISAVIAHEYFHNWSGNRVTCRDWFQISLKEGFTVFRDQSFTADTTSAAVKRIKDARLLRTYQFAEDAGPMAHPVQPDSYIEIDNFYTHTVYEKGAEVIRMMKTLIGEATFIKGANIYFANNDGKAVTIEEFIGAMEEASGRDLRHFRLWYKQSGTPQINVVTRHDAMEQKFIISTEQIIPDTADMKNKQSMHIPLAIGLYNDNGEKIASRLLELTKPQDEFVFEQMTQSPTLSLLNDFSAPVEVNYNYNEDELCFLMKHDENPFSRWEAGQVYMKNLFVNANGNEALPENYLHALRSCLLDAKTDKSFIAELMLLPTEKYVLNLSKPIEFAKKHECYQSYTLQIANALYDDFLAVYHENSTATGMDKQARAERKLKNICLYYLAKTQTKESIELAKSQYDQSEKMTDKIAAFRSLIDSENQYKAEVIKDFYLNFKESALVLDKWFSAQAMVDQENTLEVVIQLMKHEDFTLKNPNKVRALIGAFAMHNLGQFHRQDGKGYELLTDVILQLNSLNPQIAARLLEPLTHWRDFEEPNAKLMHHQLQRIKSEPKLSPDVFEIVEKSLI